MKQPLTLDWQKNPDGLLPAIIQDARTGEILMLGYMNEEGLKKTLQTGLVTFFSRSKKRLWIKGETSGNTLQFVSVSVDCDADALLIQAIPKGPTCHTGARLCFATTETPLTTLGLLIATINERSQSGTDTSYTKRLLDGGLAAYGAKVLEEAAELVRAAREEGNQRTIEEAADLLYHFFVLLRGEGIELADIAVELRKRRNFPS